MTVPYLIRRRWYFFRRKAFLLDLARWLSIFALLTAMDLWIFVMAEDRAEPMQLAQCTILMAPDVPAETVHPELYWQLSQDSEPHKGDL